MDIKIEESLDLDQDFLKCFAELNLEAIPDLSDTLDELDNGTKHSPLTENSFENIFNNTLKVESDENTNFSDNISKRDLFNGKKIPTALIKKETKNDGYNIFVKAEPLIETSLSDDENDVNSTERHLDSSSDDEHDSNLIERYPEKKRLHRKKKCERTIYPSREEFKERNLRHWNSGQIVVDSNFLQDKDSHYEHSFPSTPKSNFSVSSSDSWYINSPESESGYDTQASIHSPSPPNIAQISAYSPSSPLDEESKRKMEIYYSLLEVEKHVKNKDIKSKQNSTIYNSICHNKEEIVSNKCDPLDIYLRKGYDSLNYSNNNLFKTIYSNNYDDLDLVNDVIDHLTESQTTQVERQITDSSLKNSHRVTLQDSCKSSKVEESCKRKLGYYIE